MSPNCRYKRVLLKITGEALKGDHPSGYDPAAIDALAVTLRDTRARSGVQLALVLGGGNLWRGAFRSAGGTMDRVTADYMGMLATVMNALALRDGLLRAGVPCIVQTSVRMAPIADPFDRDAAVRALESGTVVIFACGTGSPFFTTDTTAALRALETDCDAVLKATKVDGIYSADPMKNPDAERFAEITFEEVLQRRLEVMDLSAFTMCMGKRLPIIVFNFSDPGNLDRVLRGDCAAATIVS